MILKMEKDLQIPIILGQPFLTVVGAIIDVKRGKIKLEVGEETVVFEIFKMAKDPSMVKTCLQIDTVHKFVE